MRQIIGAIIDANEQFNLIEEGDCIAVGVSGGKDSMTLLYGLHLYSQFTKGKFKVIGITLKLGFPNMDFTRIEEFCKDKNIEYHLVPTKVYDVLKEKVDNQGKIQCSLCSKFKKALLINEAKKLGCNKVAMAHHFDDGIETLFMNAIYNGYLATFKPKMYLDRTDVTFIRPLVLCKEDVIKKAVLKNNIPVVPSKCPNDKHTSREVIKQWLKEVYQKFPTAELNFQNMLLNPERVTLWESDEKGLFVK